MADNPVPDNEQGPDPERVQALYNRINELGLFKEQGSRTQQLGHRLRELGLVTDPTQGGLIPPAGTAPPAAPTAAPAPRGPWGTPPVLPPVPFGSVQAPPVATGNLAPPGGAGARGPGAPVPSPVGAPARGAQPFAPMAPTPDVKTFGRTLELEAKRLRQVDKDLARSSKELDVANELRRTRPFEFGPEREAQVKAKFDAYNATRQQQLADKTSWQQNWAKYQHLPAGTVPKIPVHAWVAPEAFTKVGNYQQILDKLPANAPPEARRQAEINYNQARVAQAHEFRQQVAAHDAVVRQIKLVGPELTRLWAQAKKGELTPATVVLLKQQTDALNASASAADRQLTDLRHVEGALTKWGKANAGKWVHNGQYFPWELNPDGTPKEGLLGGLRRVGSYLLPVTKQRLEAAHQLMGAAQQRGEYPPLPPLPATISPDLRDRLTTEKNNLWDLIEHENQWAGTDNAFEKNRVARGLANLTHYQRQILPVIRQQVAAEQKAVAQAGIGKGLGVDIVSQGIGQLLGLGAASLATRTLVSRLGPEAAALLSGRILQGGWTQAGKAIAARAGVHFVGGAAGGAAGAGAATFTMASLLGTSTPKAARMAGHAAAAGAALGGPLAAITGPAAELAGEALGGLRLPRGARRAAPQRALPPPGGEGPIVGEVPQGSPQRGGPGGGTQGPVVRPMRPRPPAVGTELTTPDGLAYVLDEVEPGGAWIVRPQKPIAELPSFSMRVADPERQWQLLGEAPSPTARPPVQPKATVKSRPVATATQTPVETVPEAPAQAAVQAIPEEPATLTNLEGQPQPYRTLTPDGVNQLATRFATAVAGGTLDPSQVGDAAVAQALARDLAAYDQQQASPAVPFTDKRVSALWKKERVPAAVQYREIEQAAQTLEKRGNTDLAQRLHQAASAVQRDYLFDYGQANGPSPLESVVPPVLAAPYRSFTPEELREMGPRAHAALVVQDVSNSLRVLDANSPGVYAINQVPKATGGNIRQVADQYYERANDVQAQAYANIPVPVAPEQVMAAPGTLGAAAQQGATPVGLPLQQVSSGLPAASTPVSVPPGDLSSQVSSPPITGTTGPQPVPAPEIPAGVSPAFPVGSQVQWEWGFPTTKSFTGTVVGYQADPTTGGTVPIVRSPSGRENPVSELLDPDANARIIGGQPVGQPEHAVPVTEAAGLGEAAAAGEGAAGLRGTAAESGGVLPTGERGAAGHGGGGTVTPGRAASETEGERAVAAGGEARERGQRRVGVGGPGSRSATGRGGRSTPVAGPGGQAEPEVAAVGPEAAAPGGHGAAERAPVRPVRGVSEQAQAALAREGLYVPYQPPANIGGRAHPAPMVETRSLAFVERPTLTHTLLLPEAQSAIASGQLSSLQLETATVAGQRHDQLLGDGTRAGLLCGDGTGSGKTLGNSAIIADNWERGVRKTVYLSVSSDLAGELQQALKSIGYGQIPVKVVQKFKAEEAIPLDFEGVIFTTYASLVEKGPDSGTFKKQERRVQLQRWLGHGSNGSEGLAIFDEGHMLVRAMRRGAQKPSLRGAAALKLQQALPGLRVVYSSATAASELGDLGYMPRLGLWGQRTAWKTHAEFAKEMAGGGETMLEAIGRDLKAQGAYLAREISFAGTEYEPLEHKLSEDQRGLYNQSALFWRGLRTELEAASEEANLTPEKRLELQRRYWGEHQRFFKELLVAFKVPTVVAAAKVDLAAGRAPVISILGTGAAREERQVETGAPFEEMDLSPSEMIGQFISNAFPQETTEGAARAQRLQTELAETLGQRLPRNALDELLAGLGHETMAEVSGRRDRFEPNAVGELERVPRGVNANKEERAAFMEGEKQGLIFTKAGAAGFGYHAAVNAKNQGRRVHYAMDHNWSAADFLQDLGRTHRANQVSAPVYRFATTDAAGEARFSATIANRLAALGAITRGERAATGGGRLEQYDVENDLGRAALEGLIAAARRGEAIEGITNPKATLSDMGLSAATRSDRQNVKQFLNRLMALEIGPQNALATAFFHRFEQAKALAIAGGKVDVGIRPLPHQEHRLLERVTLPAHSTTGVMPVYYRLEATTAAGKTVRQHLLAGAVFPLWDQLKAGQQQNFTAYTVTLPEGEVIGIGVAPNSIKRVLKALGVVTNAGPVAADHELMEQEVFERRLDPQVELAQGKLAALRQQAPSAERTRLIEGWERRLRMAEGAAGMATAAPEVQAWEKQFAPVVKAIARDVAAAVLTPAEAAKLTDVGTLLLPPEETGVTMGATVQQGGKARILLSPFVPTVSVVNGRARATWKTLEDDPNRIAMQLMQTIIHELAHLRTPAEGQELDAVQAELWDKLAENEVAFNRAVERLHRLLTGGGNDLVRTYREGRAVYLANPGAAGSHGDVGTGAGLAGAGQGERTTLLRRLPAEQGEPAGNSLAREGSGETVEAFWKGFEDNYTIAPPEWQALAQSDLKQFVALARVHRFLDPKRDSRFSHMLSELDRRKGSSRLEAAIKLSGVTQKLSDAERGMYDRTIFVNDLNESAQLQMRRIKEAKRGVSEEELRRFVNAGLPRGQTKAGVDWKVTLEVLSEAFQENEKELAKWPKVVKAVNDRRAMFKSVVEPYLAAMAKANGRKIAFDRQEYLHHAVIYFTQRAQLARMQGMSFHGEGKGDAAMLRATEMGRGFLKSREGSTMPHLTDSVAADMTVLSQMLFDTFLFETKVFVANEYGQNEALFKACLAINEGRLFDWVGERVAAANARLREGVPALTAADVFQLEFRPNQETGFQKLMKLASEGKLPDTADQRFAPIIEQMQLNYDHNAARAQQEAPGVVEIAGTPEERAVFYESLHAYLQWLGKFESGKEGAAAAQRITRASNASRAKIKAALTASDPLGSLVTPEHLIRYANRLKLGGMHSAEKAALQPFGIEELADLVGWAPGPKNPFYRSWGAMDRQADALMLDGAEALGLAPEGAVGAGLTSQRQEVIYLPSRIVATLSEMAAKRPEHWLDRKLAWFPNEWRSWIILGPTRLIPDYARRQAGHFGLTIQVHPEGFLKAVQAQQEMKALFGRHEVENIDPVLQRWLGMGGMQTTVQQALNIGPTRTPWKLVREMEAPGVRAEKGPLTLSAAKKSIRTYFEFAERVQDFREAVWRYAHYLAYLEELETTFKASRGLEQDVRPRSYGMAVPDEIDALPTLEQKAFALSDALLGAYGRISSGSRAARQKLWDIPFWGFKEANARKWGNLWANTVRGNAEGRNLQEKMIFDLGLELISGGGGGGNLPPGLPPTGGGGGGEEPWRKPAREIMARNQSRWKQILWLLKNGRLTLAALKAAIWSLGVVAFHQLWTNATIWAWNHYGVDVVRKRLRPMERRIAGQKPLSKEEAAAEQRSIDRLPPWVRNRGGGWGQWAGTDYIISPFDFSGRDVHVFNRVGTGWEVLHHGGFDDMQAYVEAWHNGGLHGVAEWFGNRLMNAAVESVGPTKIGLEITIGESLHPDIFNRRLIPNRIEYAADSVMMGTVLRGLMKHPQPEGKSWFNLIGLNVYDGREQNYQETMDHMRTWRQYQPGLPKGVGDMAEDAKSAALHQFKKATRQGLDGTPFLKDYLLHNGTVEGLKSSFQRMTPLYGLMGEQYAGYRQRFLLGGWNPVTQKQEPGQTPEQQARIREAYWYVSDLAQPPVSAEARNNQAGQAILPFVVNMDKEIKRRMDKWLDPLVAKLKAGDPALKQRLDLLERAARVREATKPKAEAK